MLGYKYDDIDDMKFTINMAAFYLPPAQEGIKARLEIIHSFLEGLQSEGHVQ
jgi:hypothetical protein